ncbi:hypothetical protein OG209_05125 [Streptomyces sp. NBC_01383]|uniref:hypothetical protein n=1 Tax=Streptomyces sp. NBC_01383 TaxID=2903846 RepID=UPI0032553609
MNWAELRDLVDALPEDSVTKAALAGDVHGRRWTQDTYIQASTYNATLLMIRILWAAHLKGQPPDMQVVEQPKREDDVRAEEEAAALTARNEQLLNTYSPRTEPADQGDIDYWQTKIRELETQQ